MSYRVLLDNYAEIMAVPSGICLRDALFCAADKALPSPNTFTLPSLLSTAFRWTEMQQIWHKHDQMLAV